MTVTYSEFRKWSTEDVHGWKDCLPYISKKKFFFLSVDEVKEGDPPEMKCNVNVKHVGH